MVNIKKHTIFYSPHGRFGIFALDHHVGQWIRPWPQGPQGSPSFLMIGKGRYRNFISDILRLNRSDRWFWMLKCNLKWLVADILPIGKKEDFQPDLCLPKNYIITMKKETIPPKKGLFMPALFFRGYKSLSWYAMHYTLQAHEDGTRKSSSSSRINSSPSGCWGRNCRVYIIRTIVDHVDDRFHGNFLDQLSSGHWSFLCLCAAGCMAWALLKRCILGSRGIILPGLEIPQARMAGCTVDHGLVGWRNL